jgi:hypothetical protein
MTQVVEQLPSKNEALSSNLSTIKKKSHLVNFMIETLRFARIPWKNVLDD